MAMVGAILAIIVREQRVQSPFAAQHPRQRARSATSASISAKTRSSVSRSARRVCTPMPNVRLELGALVAVDDRLRGRPQLLAGTILRGLARGVRRAFTGEPVLVPCDPASAITESSVCSVISRRSCMLRPDTYATTVSRIAASRATCVATAGSALAAIGSTTSGDAVPSKSRATTRRGSSPAVRAVGVGGSGGPRARHRFSFEGWAGAAWAQRPRTAARASRKDDDQAFTSLSSTRRRSDRMRRACSAWLTSRRPP